MRRLFVSLFFLALIASVGLVIYAYVSDLPAPVREVERPAAGVGFSN